MTTLLVGATGFLGSAVAARLAGRDLAVLVRPTSDRARLPRGANAGVDGAADGRVDVRVGDLGDTGGLGSLLAGVDRLVYCASMGFGHVPPLVAAMERVGVRRAVFVSTTSIFTTLPARSRSVRLAAEQAVRQSSLAWTILRPTMIYGSERDRNISRLLRLLRRTPVYPIFGTGMARLQPIFVDDLADAVVAAGDAQRTIQGAYNVAGGAPLSYRQLVRTAGHAVGRRPRLVHLPLGLAVTAARLACGVSGRFPVRPEQILRLAEDKAFDTSAAARDFGFAARTFAEGVAVEAAALGLAPRVAHGARRRRPVLR